MHKAVFSYDKGYKKSMEVLETERFFEELEIILDFIARDSLSQAMLFLDKLDIAIFSLEETPYRCRQSTKSTNVNVRDLIFKGYVIPYHVNSEKKRIEIIGIFSANEWEM